MCSATPYLANPSTIAGGASNFPTPDPATIRDGMAVATMLMIRRLFAASKGSLRSIRGLSAAATVDARRASARCSIRKETEYCRRKRLGLLHVRQMCRVERHHARTCDAVAD